MDRGCGTRAAQEIWGYCEESVRYLFGDALAEEARDEMTSLLSPAPEGVTQTEISKAFNRHKPSAELYRAPSLLEAKNQVTMEKLLEISLGPVAVWRLVARD